VEGHNSCGRFGPSSGGLYGTQLEEGSSRLFVIKAWIASARVRPEEQVLEMELLLLVQKKR
jgi:hypothetical protein